ARRRGVADLDHEAARQRHRRLLLRQRHKAKRYDMRGSIRERSPAYWQLRVFEGTDPVTGKKRYRTRYFRGGKRAAQRELAQLVTEVDSGVVTPAAKTVAALLDEWLAHIESLGRSPSTLYGYRRLTAQLPAGFKALPLKK